MAINVKEVNWVWALKDMKFTPYEEGEELLHSASYGLFQSREDAERASRELTENDSRLPRGNWVISHEFIYGYD